MTGSKTVPRYADRSERGKLRLTGPQAAWYLHQITTQDFEDIAPGATRDAAMLTPHGRMVALFEAVATDDAILLHFESALIPEFPEEMLRFVFATAVEIEDVTDSQSLVLVSGDVPEFSVPHVLHPSSWIGEPSTYVWVANEDKATVIGELVAAGAQEISEEELEQTRVAAGIPRWGFEIDSKTFPQEVGIDERVVHYDKGCYTGQEAMAKIHFRGKVNRKLVMLDSQQPLDASDVLLDGATVGKVTSVSRAEDGGFHALAVVKATVPEGASVDVGAARASLRGAA